MKAGCDENDELNQRVGRIVALTTAGTIITFLRPLMTGAAKEGTVALMGDL